MIEAMACGTPVLAFRQGSVSEIIDQGVTGAIVDTMDEAVRMLPRVIELDRHAVRRHAAPWSRKISATWTPQSSRQGASPATPRLRALFPVTRNAITLQIFHPLIAFQQHP